MDFSNGEDHIEFKSKAHQESTTPRVSASSPAIDIAPPAVRLGSAQQVTVDPPVDDVPAAEAASPFAFDDAGFSARFLSTGESRRVIRCHTNCGQASQGTAFITPALRRGDRATLTIRCRSKPGRMRYFIGCAPKRFDTNAGQAAIQRAAYALENLKAGPHLPGRACGVSAPPAFHAGSVVTLDVDLRAAPGRLTWTVDGGSAGRRYEAAVAPSAEELHAFVSLYNREAVFEVGGSVQAQEYPR